MTTFSTAIALIFPVTSFTVTSPVPIYPTIEAGTRRRPSAHIFTTASWTTRDLPKLTQTCHFG
jgi:hypothetical protein